MWGSGSKYLAPFEAFQDNGLQHVADEGNVTVRNGIIDGVKVKLAVGRRGVG